jgi:hypothetical protein
MHRAIALAVSILMLAASLAACGQGKPAVCGSVDDLKSSVQKIKDIDPSASGALNKLQTDLKAVKSNLAKVESDAKSHYSSQLKSVESSYAAVKTSIKAATADPSAATVATAGASLKALGTAVQTLIRDIESTC